MTIQNSLEMTFMPSTIQALGANLYATVPPIIAELVANSYDAMATEVLIDLRAPLKTYEKRYNRLKI
ncbi:MAG: hypothetical protein ACTILJ_00455, partial [Pseudolactococcus laudensis]|uniref:hypothetical protein n=1 Tax=Pseudolactococcus laudensis TaxID=1494461 RepID=UPI003F9E9FDF